MPDAIYRLLNLSIIDAPSRAVAYNIATLQSSKIKFLWYGSMEWHMEENFSMEWNMEWKWNGKKLPVSNMEKSSSIPYRALPERT